MRKSIVAIFTLIPVLRFAFGVTVRCNDFPLKLDCIDIEYEVISIRLRAKPNVFGVILPIRLCSATFFTFPCNPVTYAKTFFQYRSNMH